MRRGEPEPVPGPLVARFRGLGGLAEGQLVAGPWGDVSPDLHQLLKTFAESRAAALSRSQGWEVGPGQLGKIMGEDIRVAGSGTLRSRAVYAKRLDVRADGGMGAAVISAEEGLFTLQGDCTLPEVKEGGSGTTTMGRWRRRRRSRGRWRSPKGTERARPWTLNSKRS